MNKFYDFWSFVSSIVKFFVCQIKPKEIFYRSIYIRDIQRIFRKFPTILVL